MSSRSNGVMYCVLSSSMICRESVAVVLELLDLSVADRRVRDSVRNLLRALRARSRARSLRLPRTGRRTRWFAVPVTVSCARNPNRSCCGVGYALSSGCDASANSRNSPVTQVRGLLADVDGVVTDPLEAARDDDHPQPPLSELGVVARARARASTTRRFARSISSSRSTRLSAPARSRSANAFDRHPDHLFGASSHLLEGLDEHLVGLQLRARAWSSLAIVTQRSAIRSSPRLM